ncbi:MAG: hypothetical protein Hals2KO_05800 [Halioglobus sp.]
MSKFVDKEEVKQAVSIRQAVDMLGIQMSVSGQQFRGKCPLCNSEEERSFVITPAKDLWYSFCCETGGDAIKLWELVKGIPFQDACLDMLGTDMMTSDKTLPEELKPLDYLLHDDPAVLCLGFEIDDAKLIGLGYAKKGIMKGKVAIPIRLQDGRLVGYIGITEAVLPKSFRF